jgi:fused-like protein
MKIRRLENLLALQVGSIFFPFDVCLVGNSAFHSSFLYTYLSSSISFLSQALSDSDEKTRANAVGAIGNLVRNGGELCEALCQSGTPGLLLRMTLYDPSVFTKVCYHGLF